MLGFLYNTILGRILLNSIVKRKIFSIIYATYMKSSLSKHKINKFVKKYNINLNDYEESTYKSFNDFFTRKIKKENRLIDVDKKALISIADGKLKIYKITEDLKLYIKNSIYSIDELIKDKNISNKYMGGECLVLRLSLENYHRYCYIDNGKQEKNKKINGVLHTVQPISQSRYKVYAQNSREWAVLETENFDDIVQIEVGALLAGKIKNHYENNEFKKGEEKGYFEFGGSTLIILIKKGIVKFDEIFILNSNNDKETEVKLGKKIGYSISVDDKSVRL